MLIHFQAGSVRANYAKVLRQLNSLNSVLGAPWAQFELLANLAAGLGSELSGNWRVKNESEDAIKLAQVFGMGNEQAVVQAETGVSTPIIC